MRRNLPDTTKWTKFPGGIPFGFVGQTDNIGEVIDEDQKRRISEDNALRCGDGLH